MKHPDLRQKKIEDHMFSKRKKKRFEDHILFLARLD